MIFPLLKPFLSIPRPIRKILLVVIKKSTLETWNKRKNFNSKNELLTTDFLINLKNEF